MTEHREEIVFEVVANGFIAGCHRLLASISLVGVRFSDKEPYPDATHDEAHNEREISVQVEFVDDGLEIGQIVLTRLNQDQTLVQISRDALSDGTLLMYDLRSQNGEIKQRFEKIRETAPTTLQAVAKVVREKLGSLLESAE